MVRITWELKASQEIERRRLLQQEVVDKEANQKGRKKAFIIALTGLPGSGKSTSAASLANIIGEHAFILPLDGYHRKLAELNDDERYRRGAADTFDSAALIAAIKAIRDTTTTATTIVNIPGFDHSIGDPIQNQHTFSSSIHTLVIIEGLSLSPSLSPSFLPTFSLTQLPPSYLPLCLPSSLPSSLPLPFRSSPYNALLLSFFSSLIFPSSLLNWY
jgi:pantothenate kinase-related protein Tda10